MQNLILRGEKYFGLYNVHITLITDLAVINRKRGGNAMFFFLFVFFVSEWQHEGMKLDEEDMKKVWRFQHAGMEIWGLKYVAVNLECRKRLLNIIWTVKYKDSTEFNKTFYDTVPWNSVTSCWPHNIISVLDLLLKTFID